MIETQTENITYSPSNPLVIINKPEPRPDDKTWLSIENTREAHWRLSSKAFSLYMYFALFANVQAFSFKSSLFCKNFNLTEDEYMEAYNELLDHDYLTPAANKESVLCFHDYPLVVPYLTSLADEGADTEEDVW